MEICLIVNPHAGSADQYRNFCSIVEARPDVTCRETTGPGDAREITRQVLDEGVDRIGVVGGDGTVNEVVNGLARHRCHPRLGIIPLGTGNDLARTLDIPFAPAEALKLLESGPVQQLDLYRVEGEDFSRYGINVAAGGFSGQVDEELNEQMKATWGPLAYLFGAASSLPGLQDYRTYITYDDGGRQKVDALNVVVANARTAGGGRMVAPMANPQDGLLDVVVLEQCSAVELAQVALRLVTGSYQDSPFVSHRRARCVEISSRPGMWFNVDGELLTKEPLTCRVIPGAVRCAVGPNYRAEPDDHEK